MALILEVERVSKAYGGLLAVNDVSFDVEEGEIYAIVGPNGAGKTTLFEVICGSSRATSGAIRFAGRDIRRKGADSICRLGLARTFQLNISFQTQSVLTNVLVGSVFGNGSGSLTLRFPSETVERGLEALAFCDLIGRQAARAAELSAFELKRLGVATALATQCRLLLLDEPVAGLNAKERGGMVRLIERINRRGVTVVMIEHVIKAVQALAHRMMVLHHGRKILEGPPGKVLRDERVREVYLGSARVRPSAGVEEADADRS